MNTANSLIAAGTLLIAIGGIMATYGWNARTDIARKSSIVRSVAAEWVVNTAVIEDEKLSGYDENKLSQFAVFPRMMTTNLGAALASGLFLHEKDRLFLTRAANLHELLLGFNQRLQFTEERMAASSKDIRVFRTKLRDGKVRQQLLIKLTKFGELLISDYGVKSSHIFFVPLDED